MLDLSPCEHGATTAFMRRNGCSSESVSVVSSVASRPPVLHAFIHDRMYMPLRTGGRDPRELSSRSVCRSVHASHFLVRQDFRTSASHARSGARLRLLYVFVKHCVESHTHHARVASGVEWRGAGAQVCPLLLPATVSPQPRALWRSA